MSADTRHARPGILARLRRTGRPEPLERVLLPGTGAAMYLPAPAMAEVPAEPHGIATRETLERIVAEAEAQQPASPPWGPWDEPGNFPDALRAQALGDEHGRWYGWDTTVLDVPPVHARPYAPDALAAPLPRAPLSFRADFTELPAFRAAARTAGHAPAGQVRGAGVPPLPDFRIGELMHANFSGMLAMHVTGAAA
jgi:hypothetical protein